MVEFYVITNRVGSMSPFCLQTATFLLFPYVVEEEISCLFFLKVSTLILS